MNREYTALFAFCGIGGGALGFGAASVRLFDRERTFKILGGIDVDAEACEDFRRLTRAPALCVDIAGLTAAELRAFAGENAPDVVFLSPPCQGSSGLMSNTKAKTPKYERLNELAEVWTRLMLTAWPTPPSLVLFENVPRIKQRAAATLRAVKKLLRDGGYLVHEGFHDCGELGGLAQHRRRYLMVARHTPQVPGLLYKPQKKRVRACGELLGPLPMPNDPTAGPMHRHPAVQWMTLVRLALIPAGKDWKALPSQVRLPTQDRGQRFDNLYRVVDWNTPCPAIIGATRPGGGALSVADPRLDKTAFPDAYGVSGWDASVNTVTGSGGAGNGRFSVADPRLVCEPRNGVHGVLDWHEPSHTVTGSLQHDNGTGSIADPRPAFLRNIPVIIAADGTWHRPLTTLELAVLQGLPATIHGAPLALVGRSNERWREAIGNMVPVGTAEAIARQMLLTLAQAEAEKFSLSSDGDVWVREAEGLVLQ